jgi:hypothetical protein
MDDAQLNTLLALASATQTPTPAKVSEPVLSIPEERSVNKPELSMVGDKKWQEDFCTVTYVKANNRYRLYITCPVKGDKGKKIRYAIKASAKELGAKFAGDFDKKDIYWEFPTKKSAEEYIKGRKAYAKSLEKK